MSLSRDSHNGKSIVIPKMTLDSIDQSSAHDQCGMLSEGKEDEKSLKNIKSEQDHIRMKYKEFIKNMRKFIMTSRFNDATANENSNYRKKHGYMGCIYCTPDPVAQHIPTEAIMFVLEMNNDTNTIMGIGMVRNHPLCGKHFVYNNGNYNRYVYTGKTRIDRTEMTEQEDKIMQAFDILCFKGNRHMKRGQGLKSFPVDMIFGCLKVVDLLSFISDMFKKRIIR